MIRFILLTFIFCLNAFAADQYFYAPKGTNNNMIFMVKENGVYAEKFRLGANLGMTLGGANGVTVLETNKYLNADYLPSTTTTYAWHLNNASSASGASWLGGIDLTLQGSATTSSDHLGNTVYCSLGGTDDYWSSNSNVFDTANEDFTIMAWVKSSAIHNGAIASKWTESGDKRSWVLYHQAPSSAYLWVSADGTSPSRTLTSFNPAEISNNKFNHIAAVYDYTNTNFCTHTIAINGTVRKYETYNVNCNRYNSSDSVFAVGAFADTSSYNWNGQIDEVLYARTAYTPNQIRKAYAAGARRFAQIDANDVVHIEGRKKVSKTTTGMAPTNLSATASEIEKYYVPEANGYTVSLNTCIYAPQGAVVGTGITFDGVVAARASSYGVAAAGGSYDDINVSSSGYASSYVGVYTRASNANAQIHSDASGTASYTCDPVMLIQSEN